MNTKPILKQVKLTLKNVMNKFKTASPQAQEAVLEKLFAQIEKAEDNDLRELISTFRDVLETLKTQTLDKTENRTDFYESLETHRAERIGDLEGLKEIE